MPVVCFRIPIIFLDQIRSSCGTFGTLLHRPTSTFISRQTFVTLLDMWESVLGCKEGEGRCGKCGDGCRQNWELIPKKVKK